MQLEKKGKHQGMKKKIQLLISYLFKWMDFQQVKLLLFWLQPIENKYWIML
jgi:hypothetical protein